MDSKREPFGGRMFGIWDVEGEGEPVALFRSHAAAVRELERRQGINEDDMEDDDALGRTPTEGIPAAAERWVKRAGMGEASADAERAARKAEEDVWLGAMGTQANDDGRRMEALRAARKVTHEALRKLGREP